MNKPVRLQVQAPNLGEAREFLQLVTGEDDPSVTFQVFDDKAKRFDIAEWRHGKLSDPEIRKWLIRKHAEGCGIFFTMNECDGHGRKRENVTAARVLGVDFDGAPLPQEQPISFDIINESSEGRYHARPWQYGCTMHGQDRHAYRSQDRANPACHAIRHRQRACA
jgi:hypothetical protein